MCTYGKKTKAIFDNFLSHVRASKGVLLRYAIVNQLTNSIKRREKCKLDLRFLVRGEAGS